MKNLKQLGITGYRIPFINRKSLLFSIR